MEQYVSKAALVTEIKARIETYNKGYANGDDCRADALETFLHDIDSLEVKEAKEVDLEKEIELLKEDYEQVDVAWNNDFDYIARYFFELGLNAQRKIGYVPNIDDSLKELGVDPSSKEAKIFKESYCAALDKFMAQKGE